MMRELDRRVLRLEQKIEELEHALFRLMSRGVPEKLYTATEAQEFLGISPATWWRRRKAGLIPEPASTLGMQKWSAGQLEGLR